MGAQVAQAHPTQPAPHPVTEDTFSRHVDYLCGCDPGDECACESCGDPKPAKRHKASEAEWSFLRRQKLGDGCRVCGANYMNELHHLVPRSQGGDDWPANLVELCRSCHTLIEARNETVSMRLGAKLHADELAYVTQKKGAYYLNDRYKVVLRDAA